MAHVGCGVVDLRFLQDVLSHLDIVGFVVSSFEQMYKAVLTFVFLLGKDFAECPMICGHVWR